ncbi:hypothetical protein [Streptomyces lonarensis]|uniref:Uncharacterized protein n=1 Tax=Streptomyces lonarensis TaxID=700599 RepID=A0A7X6D2X5_9ACTN|nr:hypothetical protein [Streptomyces lonarensis]NJQ07207.1 hypothetical protein [Streptomyces lonarensis]
MTTGDEPDGAGTPDGRGAAPDRPVVVVTADAVDATARPHGALLLHHRRAPWSVAACVPVADADVGEVAAAVRAAALRPVRVAVGRVQPGLDMWRPHGPARASLGIHEYVTSRPATRAAYYRSQYAASAPAMRELWAAGRVQRFVGVEVCEDLEPTAHGGWDVLHVTSLTLGPLPRMLFWSRRFDTHARAAGYAGGVRELRAQWERQREKQQGRSRVRIVGQE